jgi:hypothetical protein
LRMGDRKLAFLVFISQGSLSCIPCTYISACHGGRGCTPRSRFSACREGRGCTPRSRISACHGGRGCTPRRRYSPCREGKGCTPHTCFSPFHASTVFVPSRLVYDSIAEIPRASACSYRIVAHIHHGCVGSLGRVVGARHESAHKCGSIVFLRRQRS